MDGSDWVDVSEPERLAALLGVAPAAITSDVRSALAVLTGPGAHWKTVYSRPRVPRDAVLHMQVMRSRLFVNWTDAKRVGDDIVIWGILYWSTQNVPLSTLLSGAKKFRDTVRLLSKEETALVRVIMGLAAPANPYECGVPEVDIRDAYEEAETSIDQLLDSLQSKKILCTERVGKLRLVP